jgi:hypothetical protein
MHEQHKPLAHDVPREPEPAWSDRMHRCSGSIAARDKQAGHRKATAAVRKRTIPPNDIPRSPVCMARRDVLRPIEQIGVC